MGAITRPEVREYFNAHQNEEEMLAPFLSGFSVTWAKKDYVYGTSIVFFFLNPDDFMKEAYGFSYEILLIYSPYDTMEARVLQAAESIMNDLPAKGRVETLNYFLISDDSNLKNWLNSYLLTQQESRVIVSFTSLDLLNNKGNTNFVRQELDRQFFGRDLFNYNLPLKQDTYYYGRHEILTNHIKSINNLENRGVFGLRKTGKTSLLFKIQRKIASENTGKTFFFDCKLPSIRKNRWFELLEIICEAISDEFSIKITNKLVKYSEKRIDQTFFNLITEIQENHKTKIILIFDEIEFVSFKSKLDKHWHDDYIDFWQTMWSCQSRSNVLAIIIAGVNPTVIETDKVNQIQNPLFGIFTSEYLTGLSYDDTKNMVKTLGRKMGLRFEEESLIYLHSHYGGHPSLTRRACSLMNKAIQTDNIGKPITLNKNMLLDSQDVRDGELVFYCKEIVSELKEFYPDEYSMLEYLASGQYNSYAELAQENEYTQHLKNYGLIGGDIKVNPKILIPVVSKYVGVDLASREKRDLIYKIVDVKLRSSWLEQRKFSVLSDLRLLERLIKNNSLPLLFGFNSFPEADNFQNIKVVRTKEDFASFIIVCNKCFVESIENYGKFITNNSYFWNQIKSGYPELFRSLHRIKIYRNDEGHLALNAAVNANFLEFIDEDLEGKKPSQVEDVYFVLQQRVLDSLLLSIQTEIDKLN